MELGKMSDAELKQLTEQIAKEMTIRRNRQREQLWNEVREALRKFLEECEDIEVQTDDGTYFINCDCDLSTIGEITLD